MVLNLTRTCHYIYQISSACKCRKLILFPSIRVESVVEGGGSFVTLTASESVETSSEQPPLSQPVQLAGRNWRSLAVLLLGNQNTEIVTIFFGGTSVAVLVDPDPN